MLSRILGPPHDHVVELLRSFKRPVVAGLEATDNDHRAVAWLLLNAGFETRLISCTALARTHEAMENVRDQNKPKDAQVILHMLWTGLSQHDQALRAAGIPDVQELSKGHEMVSKAKIEALHRIVTHFLGPDTPAKAKISLKRKMR